MRVVIAGGHGKIALLLERLLAEHGYQAVGLIRTPAHVADVHKAGAEAIVCDLEAAAADDVTALLSGADAMVFAAGAGSCPCNLQPVTTNIHSTFTWSPGPDRTWANGVKLSFHWCKIAAWRGQGSRWWLATGWRTVSGSGCWPGCSPRSWWTGWLTRQGSASSGSGRCRRGWWCTTCWRWCCSSSPAMPRCGTSWSRAWTGRGGSGPGCFWACSRAPRPSPTPGSGWAGR